MLIKQSGSPYGASIIFANILSPMALKQHNLWRNGTFSVMTQWTGQRLRWFLTRVRQLTATQMALLFKTFLLLLCARAALAVVPVRYIFAWKRRRINPGLTGMASQRMVAVQLVQWSVERVVNRSPIEFVCFPQCLAAIALLRAYGIDSRLHYGVARSNGQLITHTWLEAEGEVLVGGEDVSDFSSLGVY